ELLDFTVFFANVGTGGDFELGDMAAVAAPGYVDLRHAAGVARPVCYASIEGEMPAIAAALSSRPRSSYRLLSAHYNGQRHICGPAT
ncbi:glutathione S-transferase family protein, partial [Enterococcus faecium]